MLDQVRIEEVLEAEILPSLPAVAVKVLALDPETGAADMARIISADPSLSARILKAANSPLYAPLSPVGSIKRAIALLGDRQVRTLTLAFSLVPLQNALLDFSRFWEHSLATAAGTRQLLRIFSPKQAEDGFTAGLLANIGAILLAGAQPAKYQAVLKSSLRKGITAKDVEREVFGFDHTELGSAAARRWKFPGSFQAVIAHHHDPERFQGNDETRNVVQAVHLAGIFADMFHTERPELPKARFQHALKENANLKGLVLEDFARNVEEETKEASSWLGIHLSIDRSLADILEQANKKLVAISAEYEEAIQWLYRTQIDLIQLAKDGPPMRNSE
ncbi:HDOD domain-containing protein [Geoalkalibacter sp.]|uniref:HDOD domain-containing protein n=1 Tax=Geoalkalibacter sp. TaxID=3041440 RepID=UPI00272E4F24|nr:HDOD domain-containing protein [Geoalkalibacter sp.]